MLNSGVPSTSFRLWAILALMALIGVVIFVPVRIVALGYMPEDDAGRHIGKAVSGKSWNEILVMRPEITTDLHHGWDALLAFLHHQAGLSAHSLMTFSTACCFILFAGVPLFFIKRPEAWIATLGLLLVFTPAELGRFFLGRPFIVSTAVLAFVLLTWKNFNGKKTDFPHFIGFMCAMAATSWLAPTAAYLFLIPLAGFALARQWRALARITAGIVIGSVVGYAFTGHPIDLAKDVFFTLRLAPDSNILSRMLVTEFMPRSANLAVAAVIAAFIAVRLHRKTWSIAVIDNPVFWNIVSGLFLGFLVGRFWLDWGLVAAFVWIAGDLSLILESTLPFNSMKRFVAVVLLSVCFYIVITSDVQSRWTSGVPRYFLKYDKTPAAEKAWFPDSGGIMYNDNMTLFYSTLFHNPHAPWKYVLGFEPVLMKPDDLATYRNIQYSNCAEAAYFPWIKKMTAKDRMALYSEKMPQIEGLEWKCFNRYIWLGRLPGAAVRDTAVSNSNQRLEKPR